MSRQPKKTDSAKREDCWLLLFCQKVCKKTEKLVFIRWVLAISKKCCTFAPCYKGGMKETITHAGVVQSVADGVAHVRIEQASACASCQVKSHCMAADAQEKFIDCRMTEPLEAGDEVIVEIEQHLGWLAVLLAFVLPFLLMMSVLWIGNLYWSEEIAGTMALGSLLPYYGVLALFKKRLKKRFDFVAHKK